jgi:hypothetical protein
MDVLDAQLLGGDAVRVVWPEIRRFDVCDFRLIQSPDEVRQLLIPKAASYFGDTPLDDQFQGFSGRMRSVIV